MLGLAGINMELRGIVQPDQRVRKEGLTITCPCMGLG